MAVTRNSHCRRVKPKSPRAVTRLTLSNVELRTSENAYGVVYEIEGPIRTPSGRIVRFCSIWQIDTGTQVPRFITMYPR